MARHFMGGKFGEPRWYYTDCDECGDWLEQFCELYHHGEKMLCFSCLLKEMKKDGDIAETDDGWTYGGELYTDEDSLWDEIIKIHERVKEEDE